MPDYESDMKLLCGHPIHRSSDEDVDASVLATRELATIEAIQNRFGAEYEESIWNIISVAFYEGMNNAITSTSCHRAGHLSEAFSVPENTRGKQL